ncbi:WD REPEATS REGION domain-containing protein [Citrus sinensis]|uniref:WD REPEATS REGION domain-containing protein n=1 Tax=Citrus sinensis TaxID=2711 RepID=A0ACB8P649_CITSI|nr:WD REPEATS REGION domain-containing protein [Citrus sinensis]
MGIFEPYRAIGYITSSVPFSVQRLGTENFVTVSVGKAFHIYNCAKLNLVLVGPQLPKKIRALASYRDYTFAAYGNHIAVVKRAHQVATWSRHSAKVNLLLLFGEHILSIDIDGNMFIWAFKGIEENLAPVGHVKLDDKFTPTCIMHPDTYLNKVKFSFYGFVIMVIVGSQEGSLQLWNISTKKKLYEFKGWGSSISSCVSSPALDVVAVGCSDGKIHVHNVRYDEELVTFTHSMRGAVTALAFSSDGQPLLASGASSGVISIWNLEKRRLQSVIREAHDNAIISLHFFANEPVLMSASADNSIKMWIFDTTDGDPRLLRFRSGHSAPPLCIRFYANGRHILSAGQDRAFRLFSVIQILFIALPCILKDSYLNSSAAVGDAYVWRLQNFVLGEHILRPCPENPTAVKACTISACGNFAVLGTAGGWIERFNLQSGISRGSYLDMSERSNYAHNGEVVGVACDSTNTLMISAGYHGDIKVWDFKGRDLKSRWEVGCSLVKIVYHRVNGHTDRITDFCFSEDGKWLLSSGMDGSLRIWDVILARQIDAIHVDVSITALSLSPNMDVLATAHVDQNGVYLWVNRCMFSGDSNIDSYASGKEIVSVKMPSVSSVEGCQDENSSEPDVLRTDTVPKDSFGLPTFKQQIPDLVTLSLLPKSQWQSLINLDIIKARNKPIEPPKKPEKAPFFLPSVPSLSGEILFKPSESTKEDTESLKVGNKTKPDIPVSQFIQLLHSCAEMKNFSAFTDYIKSLSPSTLDMELRMLQIIDHDDHQELDKRPEYLSIELLLDYLIHEISCRNNFEFIQAVIRLFLKIHGETVRCHTKLQDKARKLLEVQSAVWQKIDKMFQSARCVVSFLSNSQL